MLPNFGNPNIYKCMSHMSNDLASQSQFPNSNKKNQQKATKVKWK